MKRAEMKRSTPMLRTGFKPAEPKPAPGRRKRKCAVCRSEFEPRNMMHKVCGSDCAAVHAAKVAAAQKAKAQRQERAADKARREGLKTYPQLIREAQAAFNAYIRLRDAALPCICCGKRFDDKSLTGGNVHAGHYRSTGSAPHLRYNEDNVHLQNAHCNLHGAGRAVDYRIGLIARIGLARVEALESDNAPRKWTHEELRELKAHYLRKVREMKRGE